MEREKAVEFSARYIELINYYNVERHDTQRDLEVFQQRNTYYVQNKCNSCRKLRVALGESSHPAYELLRGTEEHYLAAGLKLPVVLQYSPTDAEFHLGEIIVHVDDEPTIAVPIRSILPMPCLEVCPSVIDFGDLVCEHQITSQQLTLTNTGSKQGNFVFLVDQLPRVFKVSPTKVTLSPGKTVHVKVELLCKKEESFSEHLRITTDDDAMTSISVILRGAVIIPQLRLLDTSDSSCHLERVAFGDVYYGTAVSRKVLLFNDSPVFTQYLAVLNTNAEGAVDGMDANEKLATIWSKSLEICKDQSNAQSGQTLLQVVPMQGSLDPYEKRMLKMIFSPQFESSCLGWTRYQSIPVHKDYALFVQFLRIGTSSINVSLDSTLEIAVTGTARPLQLTINPGTFLDFGPCTVGKIMTEKLLLYNASDVLPVNFQCCQVAHYKCLPTSGRINPGKELPLLISFQPKQVGPLNYKMCIDMMCPGRRKFKEAFHSIIIDLHGNGQHSFEMTRKGKLPTSLVIGASSNGRNLSPQAVARYTYIDPDYCYNSEEVKVRAAHRQSFVDCNRERQIQRQWKKKEKALFNPTFATKLDLNIPPAYGLTSPALSVVQSYEPPALINQPPPSLSTAPKMLTFKDMDDLTSAPLDFIEYSSSKSVSFEVSSQCESHLSPLELSQISFEPEVLDFGSAIVDSVIEKTISIKNYSQKHICVRMELSNAQIYSKKFGSNPRFILTPQSFTEVVLSMQPGDSGTLERCVWYSINGHHKGHLPVKANVSQLTLSLSTLQLDLTEPAFASKSAGLRGSVLISNRSSVVASYQWHATEGVDPDVFSATHSTGVIPAGSSLECEFVCLPSYDCPSAAQFSLAVAGRDSAPTTAADNHLLILLPKFTKPTCEFREKRLLLGMLPLNLTTIRTLHIENKGNCHAYFKIRDASPHSGIVVSCKSGCVPVGGNVKLRVIIKPEIIELFDVKLIVDLKGGNSICLRITGTVEYPSISISEDTFRFGGVYCGARATIPFTVSNKGLVKVQLVFDLTYLSEFSLIGPVMPGSYGEGIQANDPAKGVFLVNLPGKTDAQCLLQFCPLTVASYDYQLPLLVNGMRAANCPPSSSWPPSNACSTITLHPTMPMPGKIPSCRVLATVMTSPLLVSNTVLNFSIHPGFLDEIHAPIEHQEVIKLRNVSDHPLSWALDYSTSPRLDDKTFQFCVPSGTSATNEFPTLVSAAHLQPGEEFIFTAVCQPPHHGTFDDMVSLILNGDVIRPYRNIELRASLPAGTFSINPGHVVVQPVPLRVSVIAKFTVCAEYFTSPVELSVSLPTVDSEVNLVVTFPEDSTIYNIDHSKKTEISCQLEFSSTKPISKSDYIIIADKSSDIRKRICFTVVADNDLFTLYTLLANSTPQSTTRGDNYLPSQSLQPRHETSGSHLNLAFNSPPFNDILTYTCDDYTAYTSIQDSVRGICRWLSAYGWSNGVKSISSPLDFRIRVGEDLPRTGVKQRSNIGTSRGLLLDLLTHLCGRVPPGIPLNLPPSTIASERINQLYSTYDSVISFLRNQGGLMWIVVPEALLDYHDYQQWVQDVAMNRNISFNPQNEVQFNILSQQAWTHLLMQIIKVLVLPRVIKHVPKYLEDKVCSTNADTYSIPERVLLAWLNHHYQNQQKGILRRRDFGIKQITNYDSDLMDSTVLACVLASYCPFLIEMYFEDLYEHPCHPEQCTHNAIIFIRALKHIGIDYDILPSDICSPNAISMILFILHLYERMFSFKPKETLIFEAVLGEAINQQMQLENSTSKQIEYHILIRGEDASDFHLTNGNTTITLAGHQSGQLYLTFHGHTLNPSSATLLILARGNKSAASSVQAFRLSGYVSKAKPQFSTTLTASLYELQLISLTVTNPYPKSGFFDMCISESSDEGSLLSAEMCMISTSSLQKRSDDQMHMFELANQDKIFLEPGYTISLILKFVPLKLMPRHCAITLKNKKLGDIVLSVYATVSLPKPSIPESRYLNSSTVVNSQTRTLHLKAHTGQTIEEEIIISTNNVALDNALLEISKWSMTQTEIKQRIVSESFKHVILSTAKVVLQGRDDELQNHQLEDQEKIVYSIDGSDNKHFCFPGEVCLLANNKDVATVPVKFHAEFEGQYECHLVLKSMYDVRVVIVESTVFSTDKHIELEFNTKALLPLTQNIPLINPSTVDWPFVATVNATSFQGPKFITAQSLTTTPYPLTFSPHREGFVEGDLQLTNSTDKTEYVFHLKGVAERPIAQECIKLCVQAKTSVTHVLRVHNYHERTLVFQVESDLDFISGPSSITIGGHDVVDYPLLIVPKRQGIFTGAIAFVAQAMSRPHSFSESLEATLDSSPSFHIWFQVECTVNAAPPDRVVIVSCPVLSSSVVQLSVVNPHSYPLILQVSLEGHGLSGPDHMEISPEGEASYPLTFTPTLVGQTKGRVVFNCVTNGEFWYQLDLFADNPKSTSISPISCELGKTCMLAISLTNPLDIPVRFNCNNTNTKHFIVTGLAEGQVTVEPQTSEDIHILFKPSAIGAADHAAKLVFISKQFGRHLFLLQGNGISPQEMDPINIVANLGSNSVHVINFTNPLDTAMHFSISVKGEDSEHFCLLMRHIHSIVLHPGVSLDIPIMFAPEVMRGHKANILIISDGEDSKHCWSYPVFGQPELRAHSNLLNIICRAKERFQQKFQVSLMSMLGKYDTTSIKSIAAHTEGASTEAPYSYKLIYCDNSLVEKCTGIQLTSKRVASAYSDAANTTILEFVLVFTPPKAFKCSCELYISGREGAAWIFPLRLIATPAAPDDVIIVEAAGLNTEAQVCLRLTSLTEHPVPYTAHMAGDSDSAITVIPTSGELAPVNFQGTPLYITYKPRAYGRKHRAKLVVQSESNEWCYEIIGKVPALPHPMKLNHQLEQSPIKIEHAGMDGGCGA